MRSQLPAHRLGIEIDDRLDGVTICVLLIAIVGYQIIADSVVSQKVADRVETNSANDEIDLVPQLEIRGYPPAPPAIRNLAGIAVDADGNVLVVDNGANRIDRFSVDGQPLTTWGSRGLAPGMFFAPSAVAASDDGRVFTLEPYNGGRVQIFDSNNRLTEYWSIDNSGAGTIGATTPYDQPGGFVYNDHDDSLYVADYRGGRVIKLDTEGHLKWTSTIESSTETNSPQSCPDDLSTAPDGVLWIVDPCQDLLVLMNSDGTVIDRLNTDQAIALNACNGQCFVATQAVVDGEFCVLNDQNLWCGSMDPGVMRHAALDPFGILHGSDIVFLDDRRLAIADVSRNDVTILAYPGLEFLGRIGLAAPRAYGDGRGGAPGIGPAWFFQSRDVAVGIDDSVYVADAGNARVQRFDRSGNVLSIWGEPGVHEGEFARNEYGAGPSGVAVTSDGSVLISDTLNDRIERFSSDGQFRDMWGQRGAAIGSFNRPEGLAVDKDDRLVVADLGNDRLQLFGPSHDVRGALYPSGGWTTLSTVGIASDWDGAVLLSSLYYGSILRLNFEQRTIDRVLDAVKSDPFSGPRDVTPTDSDVLWVVRGRPDALVAYSRKGVMLRTWEGFRSSADGFATPSGLARSSSGELYIADTLNHRVLQYVPRSQAGWWISRFDNPWLSEPIPMQTLQIGSELNWTSPDGGRTVLGESIRAQRQLALTPGVNNFMLSCNCGARLWLGDRLSIDDWTASNVSRAVAIPATHREGIWVQLELRQSDLEVPITVHFDQLSTTELSSAYLPSVNR